MRPLQSLIDDVVAAVDALVPKLEARHKISRVREVVDALGYGSVFLDTPPADNVLTLSGLVAAGWQAGAVSLRINFSRS